MPAPTSPFDWLIAACGLHSAAFALFHLAFWRLFDWPRSLQATTAANRAIIQILNLRLAWVFFAVAAACLLVPEEVSGSLLGRGLLGFMCLFWIGRTFEQFVFLRINRAFVHFLSAVFALGALLFGGAFWLAPQGQA